MGAHQNQPTNPNYVTVNRLAEKAAANHFEPYTNLRAAEKKRRLLSWRATLSRLVRH